MWVDDATGHPNVLDCHGALHPSSGPPLQDDTQNYDVLDGKQNGTHTILKFKRKIETCDPFDIPLSVSFLRNQLNMKII